MLQIMHKGKWVPRLAGALDRKVHLSLLMVAAKQGGKSHWLKITRDILVVTHPA